MKFAAKRSATVEVKVSKLSNRGVVQVQIGLDNQLRFEWTRIMYEPQSLIQETNLNIYAAEKGYFSR